MSLQKRSSWWLVAAFVLLVPFSTAHGANNFPNLVPLVKKLKPVVVNISTTQVKESSRQPQMSPFGGMSPLDEFFRRFLEQMPEEEQKSRSLGSGVIIDGNGYILTNDHVVEDASEIQVRLSDEREFTAQVVGRDAKTDLALIRIEADGQLPAAKLGDSDQAEVGSWVIAIGNPFGLEATVTTGIISAKGRIIGNGPYDNFLQTDAAINPGNSGGPLFNLDGEVIGINTAIFSRSGGSMGIGFAIPVNMAKSIVGQLKENGRVTRGWLGVRIQVVTEELADALGLENRDGALVASVESSSPAEAAGVQPGDVIIRFDGRQVGRMNELPAIVAGTPVGKQVQMVVIRDGQKRTLGVKIAVLSEKTKSTKDPEQGGESSLGLTVHPLSDLLRERLDLAPDTQGVVVAEVDKESSAFDAGLRAGDLISEINRQPIRSLGDFRKAVSKVTKGQPVLMLIQRDGAPLFLALQGNK
ncbi:MAG: DegQ family serine endoprotease [Magnetococcales bacterium]|nr:DegQ family serine endoprotease [Magnetococcales bacterium]